MYPDRPSKPDQPAPHAPYTGPERDHNVPAPWQPRYGLTFMLLVMLTMSIMASSGYYLVQALYGDKGDKMMFIMFTLVSPVVSVVVVSGGYGLLQLFSRR